MPDDPITSNGGTGGRTVQSRGLPSSLPQDEFGEDDLGGEIEKANANKFFFSDLVEVASFQPMLPQHARDIKERSNLDAPNIRNLEAEAAALLGFEVLLIAASFVPPLSGVASAFLLLIALGQGDNTGAVLSVAALPLAGMRRLGKLGQLASKLSPLIKPGLRALNFTGRTIAEYRALARLLLREPRMAAIVNSIRPINGTIAMEAVKSPLKVYKDTLKITKDARMAASKAGSHYHALRGAAPASGGVDFLRKGGKEMLELKTHFVPFLDEWVASKGNEAVLAYVLKDLLEQGIVRRGIVEHVFINPRNGKAVRVFVNAIDSRLKEVFEAL